MANVGVKLRIDPEIIGKLTSGKSELWFAVREDGSKNRINGEAVGEAATVSFSLAFLVAGFQWLRKKFRNRGKTKEDLAAEKKAAAINRASDALEEMLLEYLRAAREGDVDMEALDDLTDTLKEVEGYYLGGELAVPGEKELAEIRKSVADFTAEIAESKAAGPVREDGAAGTNDFGRIRDQLVRQKELIG